MTLEIKILREKLKKAKHIVFFGGAGVSTESGIPDFRSAHGIYGEAEGRNYEEMLSLRYFLNHTDDFWTFYKRVMLYPNAEPNPAHFALSRLEQQGKLDVILTQNIDGLHQKAGSQNVLELHGTVHCNSCMKCGRQYDLAYVMKIKSTPHCDGAGKPCNGTLRPNIVFYGELLNENVLERAVNAVKNCDLLLVGGTSLVVHPAAGLVNYRKRGVELVLLNRDQTPLDKLAQLVVHQNISEVLDQAVEA